VYKPFPRYHALDLCVQYSGLLLTPRWLSCYGDFVSSTNLLHGFHIVFIRLEVLCRFWFGRTMDKADNLPDSTLCIL